MSARAITRSTSLAAGISTSLQPQDTKSKHPGDSSEAVAARRRLHERGLAKPFVDAIANLVAVTENDMVLDVGCGDGYYLGELAERSCCSAHGTDLSIPAVHTAARKYPQHQWIVANADRFLPYTDASFSSILSITARMNSPEFRRVLKQNGRLLVAVAAPQDLIELRGVGRDRVARTIQEFADHFNLLEHRIVTTEAELDAPAVEDILLSIYRPLHSDPVIATKVTFSLDLLLFRPKTT